MNYKILLSTSILLTSFSAWSQNSNSTFAITGDGNGDFAWMNIRQVDIGSGKVIREVYQRAKTHFVLRDAVTKKPVDQTINHNGQVYHTPLYPTATMVAAAAYDKKHNKLFFTPMKIGELRWLDLNDKSGTTSFYTEKTNLLNGANLMDEANHITRMDIAADGNGYALTNDGNHLIRFTTGKKTIITDLGSLIDDENNKNGISIHNRCTSWGGDMIADAYGKLYVISANHQVFKIDMDTRKASHLGTITGLPANFTTNGAAVDADENIVVGSANSFEGYYKFNMNDLKAVKIENADKAFNSSDLANGNLLFQKEADAKKSFGIPAVISGTTINSDAKVYPNPVIANEFKVHFDGQQPGRYTITLTDFSGKSVLTKMATITFKTQLETVKFSRTLAKGMYMVKVSDANNQIVLTERIVVK